MGEQLPEQKATRRNYVFLWKPGAGRGGHWTVCGLFPGIEVFQVANFIIFICTLGPLYKDIGFCVVMEVKELVGKHY